MMEVMAGGTPANPATLGFYLARCWPAWMMP